MNYLFLGGNGYIGSNLTQKLLEKQEKVIILDIKDTDEKNKNLKILKMDFTNKELLNDVLAKNKVDCVINLSSSLLPSDKVDNEKEYFEKEKNNQLMIFELMKKYAVKKYVFFSSGGTVYGDNGKTVNNEKSKLNPINSYGRLKVFLENLIKEKSLEYDINYLIIRPSNPYGKNQNIYGKQGFIAVAIGKILSDLPIEIRGNGESVRDYIYIDDLVEAVYNLLEKGKWNEIYNIGTGIGTSLKQIINILEKKTEKKIDVIYKEKEKFDIDINILDISKLKNEIKVSPNLELDEGVERFLEYINLSSAS